MSNSDLIAIVSLAFTVITTLCALFLAYTALKHTTRPHIVVRMKNPVHFRCNEEALFVFEFVNVGYWYASPTAVDVTVFCNFDPAFEPIEIRYGSAQEYVNSEVRIGVGDMKFLKAKGLKLGYREGGECIHLRATTPAVAGTYRIRISAYSANDASVISEFKIFCGHTFVYNGDLFIDQNS